MISKHYPELLADDPDWAERASALGAHTHELISFLTDVLEIKAVDAAFEGTVTYHDSCSGLRELGIHAQPRSLLDGVEGLHLRDLEDSNVCCGFGGTFCVKYPDISNNMVSNKMDKIVATGAETLLAGDMGCLMNMAGKLQRDGANVRVRHVAEVLAGMANEPAIGEPQ
jgi:L-lactate dehydrogenase complex protein LldE